MTIAKREDGYEIFLKAYIEDTLKFYGKKVKDYLTPARQIHVKITDPLSL